MLPSPKTVLTLIAAAMAALPLLSGVATAQNLTPQDAREIAKEAYIYAFPMVDNYRVQYAYFQDPTNPEYKAPRNILFNIPRVFTPDDKAIQTPNSDTPYSWIGMDLRAEPLVFTIPAIADDRYWSLQLIDLYTYNFDYLGSRATGNGGGSFVIAGPGWSGDVPKGVTKVIQTETEILSAQFRTQLFSPDDLENVKAIQNQYIVQPLSAFLGKPAPAPAPEIDWVKPLSPEAQRESPEVFGILNFLLQFAPVHPSETDLRARFAKIGVGPGMTFDFDGMTPEMQEAIKGGIADAWAEFDALKLKINAGEVTSGDVLGTREHLNNNYLYRMAGAALGIYGNSKAEAMYPAYFVDAKGQPLDGVNHYTLHFAPGQEPPVNSFWSITMYDQPASLLVANPINRYLLNSAMDDSFVRDADGGLTIYMQSESPGPELEANWLPAPAGPFAVFMRLYWPKEQALDGTWVAPPIVKTE